MAKFRKIVKKINKKSKKEGVWVSLLCKGGGSGQKIE